MENNENDKNEAIEIELSDVNLKNYTLSMFKVWFNIVYVEQKKNTKELIECNKNLTKIIYILAIPYLITIASSIFYIIVHIFI